jgi:di/tricarboxylate transporter
VRPVACCDTDGHGHRARLWWTRRRQARAGLVAIAVLWAVPFVALAIRHRKAVAIVPAVLVVGIGVVASVDLYVHPIAFCF